MTARTKRVAVIILAIMLVVTLVAAAYAATSGAKAEPKAKKPTVNTGKNWKIKGGGIRPKGKPQPKKILKDTRDAAAEQSIIEKRPRPDGKHMLSPAETAGN
jgi:Spy/CpxP family protein refolding chaperone